MKKFVQLLVAFVMCSTLCACKESTKNDDTFVVGMECAYAPFNWQVGEATDTSVSLGNMGHADGYDVQIAKKIADELGKELVIKKISWDGLILALNSDEIDAIIAGMTATEAREEGVDFSTPYYDSQGMIMIVRKDSEMVNYTDIQQFSGKKIVGQKGTSYDDVIDQIEGVNHIPPKSTYPEMVVALQMGDVDGITAEMAVAEGVLAANDNLTVVKFEEGKGFEADTTVSIGLKEGTRGSKFYNEVQAALDRISFDERTQFMSHAVFNQPVEE